MERRRCFGPLLPIRRVCRCKHRVVVDEQDIFGILLLRGFREFEAPGDHGTPIDHHHLVLRLRYLVGETRRFIRTMVIV
jgi:hypothetical protein